MHCGITDALWGQKDEAFILLDLRLSELPKDYICYLTTKWYTLAKQEENDTSLFKVMNKHEGINLPAIYLSDLCKTV